MFLAEFELDEAKIKILNQSMLFHRMDRFYPYDFTPSKRKPKQFGSLNYDRYDYQGGYLVQPDRTLLLVPNNIQIKICLEKRHCLVTDIGWSGFKVFPVNLGQDFLMIHCALHDDLLPITRQ